MSVPWLTSRLLNLSVMVFLLSHPSAFGSLNEIFEIYSSPAGLAMGNALTSNATGYTANYYNPAGLAKASKKKWEIHGLAFETIVGGIGTLYAAKAFSVHALSNRLQNEPNTYYYHRLNFIPAVSTRGFATSFLGYFEYAGRSDGTTLDVRSVSDVVPTVGGAVNLAGNLLKIGVSLKGILRNELTGSFEHSLLATEADALSQMREGFGLSADLGMMVTFPASNLPTIGLAVKDVGGTRFSQTRILNPRNVGKPDTIPQSINAGVSIHPTFAKGLKSTFSLELRHLERTDIAIANRTSLGFQIEDEKTFYFWLGMSQLCWTAGVAYRIAGGHLELGSYGTDVGTAAREENRRWMLRYTIGF